MDVLQGRDALHELWEHDGLQGHGEWHGLLGLHGVQHELQEWDVKGQHVQGRRVKQHECHHDYQKWKMGSQQQGEGW